MHNYLTFDIGTTSLKTALISDEGTVLAVHTEEYHLRTPQAGWAEMEPEAYWRAAVAGVRAVLAHPHESRVASRESRAGEGATSPWRDAGATGAAPSRLFLGTAVNATAVTRAAGEAARELGVEVLLVPAGSVEDETRFNMEDHLASGVLLSKLQEQFPAARVANDAARAAQGLFARVGEKRLPQAFLRTDHGRRLVEVGLADDVRWCARVDVYQAVPVLTATRPLADGGTGAVFANQS